MMKYDEKMEAFQCTKCFKNLFNALNLKYHMKICSKIKRFYCPKCELELESQSTFNRHVVKCGKFICTKCHIPFLNAKYLNYHMNHSCRKTDNPVVSKVYSCRLCNFRCNFKGDLYTHRLLQHGSGDSQLQPVPWEEDSDPFDNADIRQVYNVNRSHILAQHDKGNLKSTYNFPTNNLEKGYEEIQSHIEDIYEQQSTAFKINLSFGLILYNIDTKSYRYFIPFHNSRAMKFPRLISGRRSITLMMNTLKKMDIIELARKDRPSSAWSLAFITNINYYVYNMQYPIGRLVSQDIPLYIRQCKFIKNFPKSTYNLCFFQCLAFHYRNVHPPELYLKKWFEFNNSIPFTLNHLTKFPGVFHKDFLSLEKCFNIGIKVYSKSERGIVSKIYDSSFKSTDVIFLNLYSHHLSYVTNFNAYAPKFECSKCFKFFTREWNLKRHTDICFENKKLSFPGGLFTSKQTLFENLEMVGVSVGSVSRLYPYFAVWDMEALLLKSNCKISDNLEWISKHVPISVSIASNVPGFEAPICFVETNIDHLISTMLTYLKKISKSVQDILTAEWEDIYEQIDESIELYNNNDFLQPHLKSHFTSHLSNLKRLVDQYISQLPVVGFNSGKYDVNLVKHHLIMALYTSDSSKQLHCIKRNNSYLSLSNDFLKFIDISNYLAPGYSYSQFLKAYGCLDEKGYFPYEWFDSYDKLNYNSLPSQDSFYSTLTKSNPVESVEIYKGLKKFGNLTT